MWRHCGIRHVPFNAQSIARHAVCTGERALTARYTTTRRSLLFSAYNRVSAGPLRANCHGHLSIRFLSSQTWSPAANSAASTSASAEVSTEGTACPILTGTEAVSSTILPPQSMPQRRGRRRRLAYSGDSGDGVDGGNSGNSAGDSRSGTKAGRRAGTATSGPDLRLALPFDETLAEHCLLRIAEQDSMFDQLILPVDEAFRREFSLMLRAALRPRTRPLDDPAPQPPSSKTLAACQLSDSDWPAWYAVRDHIALRPSTRNMAPWLDQLVMLAAQDLSVPVCQLDAWKLQSLFSTLLPHSDELWPVYPRRTHDGTLAATDDAFVEVIGEDEEKNGEATVAEYDDDEYDDEFDESNEDAGEEDLDAMEDRLDAARAARSLGYGSRMRGHNSNVFLLDNMATHSMLPDRAMSGSVGIVGAGSLQAAAEIADVIAGRVRPSRQTRVTLEDRMAATFHRFFLQLAARATSGGSSATTPGPLLVHIGQAMDLSLTRTGQTALQAMLRAVHDIRREGGRIALVAVCTESSIFTSEIDIAANFNGNGSIWDAFVPMRVPSSTALPTTSEATIDNSADSTQPEETSQPATNDASTEQDANITVNVEDRLALARKRHFLYINRQNITRMLEQRGTHTALTGLSEQLSNISEEIWPLDRVARVVNTAIGLASETDQEARPLISLAELTDAVNVVDANISCLAMPVDTTEALVSTASDALSTSSSLQAMASERHAQQLQRGGFSTYERRLLSCLVNPVNMATTFQDVIVAPSTVRALQTQISLPLLYPDHFAHGILADNALTGILMFGPPGTGKTMLARAVASESGSSMLEIKGSDIYDKYVGESEKNVRAIFSLARKMSPCVIFIDEVDALFASRGSDIGGGSGKRETVNQFMAEWDGLRSNAQNRGITVMCATNRPFDLDDAVLRRMPRRILVDLPSLTDRERILSRVLSREQLAEDVTAADMAARTPLYSGSDLKNLCVTAALAAVREQVGGSDANTQTFLDLTPFNDNAAPAAKDRVLARRHFELALREIAPSSSEEMQTLSELRKWDRLYGDGGDGTGRFRRRPGSGLGFGTSAPHPAPKTSSHTATV